MHAGPGLVLFVFVCSFYTEDAVVWLNAMACRVLDALRSKEAAETDRVFAEAEYLSPENISVSFHRACKRVGIEDFRLHDLRHTCASWMRMRGCDIHTVATQLGHDVRQAARYQHLSGEFLYGAVCSLDGVFTPELVATDTRESVPYVPTVTSAHLLNPAQGQ